MAKQLVENSFKLNQGVDGYGPDVSEGGLSFVRLSNVHPGFDRLLTPVGLQVKENLVSQTVRALGSYTEPYSQYSALYAICDTSVFNFNFQAGFFSATSMYSFGAGNLPYALVPWYDKLYVTKKNAGLVRLQGELAALVPDAPGGRYMVSANSHLMLANISSSSLVQPNRVQWSDLYAPESFLVSTASEADFFELDPGQGEITGLTAQRSNQVVYTANSIIVGTYNPLPTGFRFQTLYTGIGNTLHGAVVQVKDRDFFIGQDNFYVMDGLQLSAIGDPIFKYFTDTNLSKGSRDSLATLVDLRKNEVSWVYDHIDGKRWSVVYNFKENKWSERDPQNVVTSLHLIHPLRGFRTIDSVSAVIDTMSSTITDLIDGDWQFPEYPQINYYGANAGQILTESGKWGKSDGTPFKCYGETHEVFAGSLFDIKEFDRLKLLYSGQGSPNLEVLVGTRKNRFAEVTWSPPLKIAEQLPGETSFFVRRNSVGHLVRFAFQWDNTNVDYINELTNLSFKRVEISDDVEK